MSESQADPTGERGDSGDGIDYDDLPDPEFDGRLPTDDLHVDGENPNEMSDDVFELLVERLQSRGWVGGPIVANDGDLPGFDGDVPTDGLIADGEHRWLAAREIGLSEVPVIKIDFEDDAERRLARQELNKISGEHDQERDALEYDEIMGGGRTDELFDLVDASGEDIGDILDDMNGSGSTVSPAYEYDVDPNIYWEDAVKGIPRRVDAETVAALIADPPYGIDYDGEQLGRIEGDESLDGALSLLRDVLTSAKDCLIDGGHIYIFWSSQAIGPAKEVIDDVFDVQNVCVWYKNKSNILVSQDRTQYAYTWEPVFFATNGDDPRELSGDPTSLTDVFEYPRVHDFDHPTQKPIALISEFVKRSTEPGELILDPFIGSGTTGVAAVDLDRDYVGFEVDESHRPVVERRLSDALRSSDNGGSGGE